MKVKGYQPAFEVTLHKTIKRQTVDGVTPVSARFSGSNPRVDLTPYLGENSAIRTTKSVSEAAGGFMLTLLDRPFGGYLDDSRGSRPPGAESMYGIVEAMDVIEIRFKHAADGSRPPIVMRGFVSDIERVESMSADGKPQRLVTISGQDYGKLWQQMQIRYLNGYVIGEEILTSFSLFERFGGSLKNSSSAFDLVNLFLSNIINPHLEKLIPPESAAVKTITLDDDAIGTVHGTTSLYGPQNSEGTVYQLLRRYLDVGLWNELFMEDRDDGVYLVLRPNPYKDVSGKLIGPAILTPDVVEVDVEDIISLHVVRGDSDVANYYWVRAPLFEMTDDLARRQSAMQQAPGSTVDASQYANSAVDLYGIRLMEVTTEMGADTITNFGSGLSAPQIDSRGTTELGWIDMLRESLVNQNKDNILFERGSMRIRGNEAIRSGIYVRLVRGTFRAEYYVSSVSHEYLPFGGFFSTLSLKRGTGFIERIKRDGGQDAPYFSEMA